MSSWIRANFKTDHRRAARRSTSKTSCPYRSSTRPLPLDLDLQLFLCRPTVSFGLGRRPSGFYRGLVLLDRCPR